MMEPVWLYCSLCERAFHSNSKNSCKYDWCDGGLGDIWGWEVVRQLNGGYPGTPLLDVKYPLFDDRHRMNLRHNR
jgi:hypothetical protein